MRGSDFLIYGLLVLGWLVFTVVSQLLRRYRQAAAQHAADAAAAAPQRVPLDAAWGRAAQREALPAREQFEALVDLPTARRRQPAAARAHPPYRLPPLRSPRDLRQAIALTAILGPCRAQQPYEAPDTPR